jgi:hypothetical protein
MSTLDERRQTAFAGVEPDGKTIHPIELKWAEPGVKMGQ